jgi:hypothetical protein
MDEQTDIRCKIVFRSLSDVCRNATQDELPGPPS